MNYSKQVAEWFDTHTPICSDLAKIILEYSSDPLSIERAARVQVELNDMVILRINSYNHMPGFYGHYNFKKFRSARLFDRYSLFTVQHKRSFYYTMGSFFLSNSFGYDAPTLKQKIVASGYGDFGMIELLLERDGRVYLRLY